MEQGNQISKGKIGVFSLVFFVVAGASPLTGLVGGMPIAILSGNGAGVPGIYILSGLILLLFSIGFITMSRYISNSGAFYAYISVGLGRKLGVSGLGLAILTYVAIELAIVAMFGMFTQIFFNAYVGFDLPWWVYSIAMLLVVCLLGIERIEIGGRVLGLLMLLEVGIAVIIAAVAAIDTAQRGALDFTSFSPSILFSGNVGITLVFGLAGFIGFEATAIYTEECRSPERTVPVATIIAVLLITVFFTFCSWAMIQPYGADAVQAEVAKDPSLFVFNIGEHYFGKWIVVLINFLLITSLFAATQSFHNTIARYFYNMARDGIFWSKLAAIHPNKFTPYMASIWQTITMVAIVAVLAILKQDPMVDIFTWGSTIATMSILVLQILVSSAVINYFQNNTHLQQSPWKVLWIPILASIGMLIALWIVMSNLHEISGLTSNWVYLIPALVFGSAIFGYVYAIILKKLRPAIFTKLDEIMKHI